MQLLFETMTSCQTLPFSRQTLKISYLDAFTDRCTQQATAWSIPGCRRMLRTKERGSLLFFIMVLMHLVCAKSTALFSYCHWQEPGLRLFILPTAKRDAGAEGRWTTKSDGGRRDSHNANFYTATSFIVLILILLELHPYLGRLSTGAPTLPTAHWTAAPTLEKNIEQTKGSSEGFYSLHCLESPVKPWDTLSSPDHDLQVTGQLQVRWVPVTLDEEVSLTLWYEAEVLAGL